MGAMWHDGWHEHSSMMGGMEMVASRVGHRVAAWCLREQVLSAMPSRSCTPRHKRRRGSCRCDGMAGQVDLRMLVICASV